LEKKVYIHCPCDIHNNSVHCEQYNAVRRVTFFRK